MYEPEGLFSDPQRERAPPRERAVWTLTLRPEPGIDEKREVRAMRWLLKSLLRRFGFRCLSASRKPAPSDAA